MLTRRRRTASCFALFFALFLGLQLGIACPTAADGENGGVDPPMPPGGGSAWAGGHQGVLVDSLVRMLPRILRWTLL